MIFELAESSVIYSVQLLSGVGRGDHRLLTFKIDMNVDNQWIIPNGLSVQEAPEATIESDGFIKLDSAITDLTVLFNPVINVASIRLTVTGHLIYLCKKSQGFFTTSIVDRQLLRQMFGKKLLIFSSLFLLSKLK